MKGTVQRWGNSLAVRLPKAYADDVGLAENSPVEIKREGETITIIPLQQSRRRGQRKPLKDYLHRINRRNIHAETDTGDQQGKEML